MRIWNFPVDTIRTFSAKYGELKRRSNQKISNELAYLLSNAIVEIYYSKR